MWVKRLFSLALSAIKLRKAALPRQQQPEETGPKNKNKSKKKKKKKKTLVLDLDNTLVHCRVERLSCSVPLPEPELGYESVAVVEVAGEETTVESYAIHMKVRPGAAELMRELREAYELVVFSAGSSAYVNAVVDFLDPTRALVPPSHRLSREHCLWLRHGHSAHRKDLGILGRDLRAVVVLDDNPLVFSRRHRRNVIAVPPFYFKASAGSGPGGGPVTPASGAVPACVSSESAAASVLRPKSSAGIRSAPVSPLRVFPRKEDALTQLLPFLKDIASADGDVRKHIAGVEYQLC